MQCSFGINMLAIVAGRPKVLTLRDAIGYFRITSYNVCYTKLLRGEFHRRGEAALFFR